MPITSLIYKDLQQRKTSSFCTVTSSFPPLLLLSLSPSPPSPYPFKMFSTNANILNEMCLLEMKLKPMMAIETELHQPSILYLIGLLPFKSIAPLLRNQTN